MKESFLERKTKTFLKRRHGDDGGALHAAERFFIAEAARKENSTFKPVAGDAVLDDLDLVLIAGATNKFETPLRMAGSYASKSFGQEGLGFAAADGTDAKHDGFTIVKIGWRCIGGEK